MCLCFAEMRLSLSLTQPDLEAAILAVPTGGLSPHHPALRGLRILLPSFHALARLRKRRQSTI